MSTLIVIPDSPYCGHVSSFLFVVAIGFLGTFLVM
jgi:hypothetical protein